MDRTLFLFQHTTSGSRAPQNRDRIARQTVMRALNAPLLAHRLRQVAGDEAPAFDKAHC